KIRTLLETIPTALGDNGGGNTLRFVDGDGQTQTSGAALLVSNNRYRLGKPVGSGTRPRLDAGVLGVALVHAGAHQRPWWEDWTAPAFDVEATGLVAAGIDGEKAQLEPPLRFRI